MGSPSEPVRKYDVQRWNNTWDRIRAKQAEERAAAAAAELRADIDIQPEAATPTVPVDKQS